MATAVIDLLPRKQTKRKAKLEGNRLFDRRNTLTQGTCLSVCFTERGMQASTDEECGEIIPYDRFLCILETEDLLLIAVENQGFLVAKTELNFGEFSDFKSYLSAKVHWITERGAINAAKPEQTLTDNFDTIPEQMTRQYICHHRGVERLSGTGQPMRRSDL